MGKTKSNKYLEQNKTNRPNNNNKPNNVHGWMELNYGYVMDNMSINKKLSLAEVSKSFHNY